MADKLNKVNEQINRSIGQRLQGASRDVAKRFAQTLNSTREMIAQLYERYSTEGVLTYTEMVKYDRLTKFMAEVNSVMGHNYKDVYKIVYGVLGWTYAETWDMSAWAIETDAKAKLGYGTASAEQLHAMLNNPIAGLTLKQTLEKSRQSIVWTIQSQVTQGLARGETYRNMMDRVKPALEDDAVKAMRVVRTEGHRVQESAKIDAAVHADKQGVRMMKTWRTSKDERVRKTRSANHERLEGVKIPVDEDFVGTTGKGPAPGQLGKAAEDINCRCFLQYTVDRVEKKQYDELEQLGFDKWRQERQA